MRQSNASAARSRRRSALPLLVIAVASIVLGLLSMHSLVGVDPAARSSSSGMQADCPLGDRPLAFSDSVGSAAIIAGGTEASDSDAAPLPRGGCFDLAEVCALAMLLIIALLWLTGPVSWSRLSRWATRIGHPFVRARAVWLQPSLVQLSISRT